MTIADPLILDIVRLVEAHGGLLGPSTRDRLETLCLELYALGRGAARLARAPDALAAGACSVCMSATDDPTLCLACHEIGVAAGKGPL